MHRASKELVPPARSPRLRDGLETLGVPSSVHPPPAPPPHSRPPRQLPYWIECRFWEDEAKLFKKPTKCPERKVCKKVLLFDVPSGCGERADTTG